MMVRGEPDVPAGDAVRHRRAAAAHPASSSKGQRSSWWATASSSARRCRSCWRRTRSAGTPRSRCCHMKTRDLATHTRRADILVAAAGVPEMITADMVKPGATVIDVGVHRTATGLVGDVRVRRGGRGRRRHHAGARRRRADDGRDAAASTPWRRPRRRRIGNVSPSEAASPRILARGQLLRHRRGGAAALRRTARAVTEQAAALVGYVDAANVTDNPTASRAHVGARRGGVRGRGGRRADGAAHLPRSEPLGDHRGPAGGVGARRAQPAVPDGRPDWTIGDHPDAKAVNDLVGAGAGGLAGACGTEGTTLSGAEIGEPASLLDRRGRRAAGRPGTTRPPGGEGRRRRRLS